MIPAMHLSKLPLTLTLTALPCELMRSANKAYFPSCIYLLSALLLSSSSTAQDTVLLDYTGENYNRDAVKPRDVTVLTETLAEQEIDRAVFNRLLREISEESANTKSRLGLSDEQLEEVFIILSNARGFINGSEMQNVRAMCETWGASALAGEQRISEALDAYRAREQLTKNFIANYYSVVLFDIEAILDARSLPRFRAYMEDRRRRMANAGAASFGAPVQNIRAGTDTINFHCR